jgi:hypothetical protein
MEVKEKKPNFIIKKPIQKGKGGTQREDQHTKQRQCLKCLKVKGGKMHLPKSKFQT